MGWNTIDAAPGNFIDATCAGEYLYFVHSYYAPVCSHTVATCNYIAPFSAALQKDNFFATQFHPEANAGPKDTEYLFNRFIESMGGAK